MDAICGAIVKGLSPYIIAGASICIIDRCCPPTDPPAEGGAAAARADAPRTPNGLQVPLGDVLRRDRAIEQARLQFARARLAADETRAAAEAEAAAAGAVGEAPPAGAVGEAPPADDDIGLLDPILALPLIPMANIMRIRRREVRSLRVPRLA